MKQFSIINLVLLLLTLSAFGQETPLLKHPIDLKREYCHSIVANQTTAGMIQCESTARDEWEVEMNNYYKLLMGTLTREEKEKLKVSQQKWQDYREKELDFFLTLYDNMQGTMWRVVRAGRICDIIKERALELKAYYGMLEFGRVEK